MRERDFQGAVLHLARLLGVRSAHFRAARTAVGWATAVSGDGAGFPDVVFVGSGGVLFRELKSEKGRLSPEQKCWAGALQMAGADFAVWRPVDLQSGRVERELRGVGGSDDGRWV